MWIPETQHTFAGNHRDNGIGAFATLMQTVNCLEQIFRPHTRRTNTMQFMGQYIQQNFRV